MLKYKKGLKLKVQNAFIFIKDATMICKLIDQAVKINNQIYQREKIGKNINKPVKAPQQAPRQ